MHGFSADEWELLTELPLEIYIAMLGVDIAVDSFREEEVAFGTWVEKLAQECAAGSWMRAAFEGAEHPSLAQARGGATMSESELDAHLREVGDLLRRKVGDADAARYSELLIKLADHVASATAGAFPGGPRVTQAEGDLIWRMRRALGLMRTLHP
jgi:hypothetical protein